MIENEARQPRTVAATPAPAEAAAPAPAKESATPFEAEEIRAACARPHRLVELVLGTRDRLMANVSERSSLGLLVLVLLCASLLFAVPYGAIPPVGGFWKISLLFTGSLVICLPSLFVFGQYLGLRLTFSQTLALTLLVSTTAAMFTLGFFPIVWFIHATTVAGGSTVAATLSTILLGASLFFGIAQLFRCIAAVKLLPAGAFMIVFAWVGLLAFITYRMALALGVFS